MTWKTDGRVPAECTRCDCRRDLSDELPAMPPAHDSPGADAQILDLRPRLNPEGQPRKGDVRTRVLVVEEWDGLKWVPLATEAAHPDVDQ